MHSYLKGLEMFGNFSQSPHPTKGRCCGSSFFSQRACWYVAGVHSLSSYFCINHSILLIDNCIYEDHGTIDDSATYSPTACTPHPRTSRPSPSPPWWMPMPRRGRLMKRGPDWKRWSRKWLPTSRWDGRWPWMGDESQREPCRKAWGSNDEPPRNLIDLGWFVRKNPSFRGTRWGRCTYNNLIHSIPCHTQMTNPGILDEGWPQGLFWWGQSPCSVLLVHRRSLRMSALRIRNWWECGHGSSQLWDQRLIMFIGGMNIQPTPTISWHDHPATCAMPNFQLGVIHGIHVFKVALPLSCQWWWGFVYTLPNLRLQETARIRDGWCPEGASAA